MDHADRANPYAPPAAASARRPARAAVGDETAVAIRRAALGSEALARLAGSTLIVAAAVGLVAVVSMTASDYAMVVDRAIPEGGRSRFWRETAAVVAMFLLPVSAVAAVGIGLRLLRGWSYHGALTLLGMIALVGVAAASASLQVRIGFASFWLLGVAVAITLLIGQRFWSRVPFVLSPEYRAIVARTRHVRSAWLVVVEVALVVLGLAGAGLVAAAILR
ncbi:MAG TPA: hypothetical protein VG406_00890 [Isosphaeraceae bacterium]|jgi:hypothetical protein|nr:hypothetical protein [Isosphaeraceae bacterium]